MPLGGSYNYSESICMTFCKYLFYFSMFPTNQNKRMELREKQEGKGKAVENNGLL